MFTFVRAALTFLQTVLCHIRIHVNDLNLVSGGGGDGGGATGKKTSKPVTAVQGCVSAFVSVTTLSIFKMTSGQFPAVFVVLVAKT